MTPWRLPALFAGLPVLVWALGDHAQRTLLKTSLSLVTLAAFGLMLGLFWLSRLHQPALKRYGAPGLLAWHKGIGYAVAAVVLLHPLLVVLPRFFEAGVEPLEALAVILQNFARPGVLAGILAWIFCLLLGAMSLLRRHLGLNGHRWRDLHGCLAGLASTAATWHVINLGRHSDLRMKVLLLLAALGGLALLVNNTFRQDPVFRRRA